MRRGTTHGREAWTAGRMLKSIQCGGIGGRRAITVLLHSSGRGGEWFRECCPVGSVLAALCRRYPRRGRLASLGLSKGSPHWRCTLRRAHRQRRGSRPRWREHWVRPSPSGQGCGCSCDWCSSSWVRRSCPTSSCRVVRLSFPGRPGLSFRTRLFFRRRCPCRHASRTRGS